ncbi:MAG: hypothetical protein CVV21_00985 [Candidatus Goldiibacteriota bacterium HGW-Goldbacteria-1]|jgi:uncharacterized membrane protein|nr:MAG: hypothetical protein CVV21_00985 [Candidatus Goldiibacteriota bacterium HGW-Goldbacteria-1]
MADEKKTSLGIDENVEGLLCYVFGWVTGLIFLLTEKESKFVKFHALQSIFFSIASFVAGIMGIALAFIPVIGPLLSPAVTLGIIALWVILMVKAYQKEMFKLPVIGDMAEKQV